MGILQPELQEILRHHTIVILIQHLPNTYQQTASVLKSLQSEYTKWGKRKKWKIKHPVRRKNAIVYKDHNNAKPFFFFLLTEKILHRTASDIEQAQGKKLSFKGLKRNTVLNSNSRS